MDKDELQGKKIAELKTIAEAAGIANLDALKKSEIIEKLLEAGSEGDNESLENKPKRKRKRAIESPNEEKDESQPDLFESKKESKEETKPSEDNANIEDNTVAEKKKDQTILVFHQVQRKTTYNKNKKQKKKQQKNKKEKKTKKTTETKKN